MTISDDPVVSGRESPFGEIYQRSLVADETTRSLFDALRALQERYDLYDVVAIESTERGIVIHFTDRVLFDTGRAEIKPEAREVLQAVAVELAKLPHHIRVEGHTDNVPIHNERFPSNWELSTARAVTVLRFLIQVGGLDPGRLSAVGYGEYRPIASNDTPEGRARNRRVDIVLLDHGLAAFEPVSATLD
ncbi:MAG: OmpA family protein [Clostridia bacterium]